MEKTDNLRQSKKPTSRGKKRAPAKGAAKEGAPKKTPAPAPSPQPDKKKFPIVGVGASAGGLEAFQRLLEHLSVDSGMAFVLVQHLDPTHESALTEILTRATSMSVQEASDKLKIKSNHVYVIPPNVEMTIENDALRLKARRQPSRAHHSIDEFFESLARDQQECAIGIILSGTASDGTLGLEAIKGEGGITFAQDFTAKYDAMPRSAIAAGCVDFILAPDAIARELERIAKHPYVKGAIRELPAKTAPQAQAIKLSLPSGALSDTAQDGFKKILLQLRNSSGVDFSLYKPTTIHRRINRRMVLHKIESVESYADFLKRNDSELDALYSDLLINVTSFFRNPETFEALKHEVFSKLVQERRDDALRVWVVGCSSGQEAYSIAMAYLEFCEKIPRAPRLQIFATDLNETLLEKARQGYYAKGLVQDVSPTRLRRFFVEEEGGYRVAKPLRDLCIFARQNLLSDPPFSRMDLISCRNLLIYIEPALQNKILPTFHYALKPQGFLFLGTSETVGPFTTLFKPINKTLRIFSRKSGVMPTFNLPSGETPATSRRHDLRAGEKTPPIAAAEFTPQREADRITGHRFAPPGVLVNADLQILQFRGATGAYLEPATGKASFDLLKMARPGLILPLRTAINKAGKQGNSVRTENVRIGSGAEVQWIHLEVIPLKNLKERCYLIFFEEAQEGKKTVAELVSKKTSGRGKTEGTRVPALHRRIGELERELVETRDYLQSIQEQYEASNEELQASNEEATSANEELQSLNEEMETSKEELESTNEELTTVSEEMANRNLELNQLNSDLSNLHASIQMPILVLGRDLTIRRFTPLAQRLFNLLASDIGRPLSGIKHNLVFDDLELFIVETISSISPHEREVQDRDDNWFTLRVRPYLTLDNKIDGAVLMLVDINALKQTEKKITETRNFAQAVVESAPPLLILESNLRVRSANGAFYKMFGVTAHQTEQRLFYELGNGQWNIPKLRKLLEAIVPHNSSFQDYEVTHNFEAIGQRTMSLSGHKVDSMPTIILCIEDITARKKAEEIARHQHAKEAQRLSEERFQQLANGIPNIAWMANADGSIYWFNNRCYEYSGATPEQLEGWGWQRLIDSGYLSNVLKGWKASIANGHPMQVEFPMRGADGQFRPFLTQLVPMKDDQGQVVQWFGTSTDISDLVQARDVLARSREELEKLIQERTGKLEEAISELLHFSYTITHDMRAPLRAMRGYSDLLETQETSLSAQGQVYAKRIGEAAERMDKLITDALDYAKLSQNTFEICAVDAGSLLRSMLDSYPLYQPPAVKISIAEQMPPVLANEAGLIQCFSNLLNNAVKFVQPGKTPEIRIWAEEREQPAEATAPETGSSSPQAIVRFWVEDNGIGIPVEYQAKVFGMFERLSVEYEGTGIGLALVKKAAQRMNGSVGFESEPGKGSRFWLEFKKAG